MPVKAKWLGESGTFLALAGLERPVDHDEIVTFPGDMVDDDPDAAPDGIVIEREDGTRHALAFSLWELAGPERNVKTIGQVLDGVDGDPAKAAAALDAEHKRVKPRKTLVAELERISAAGPVPAASELPKIEEQPPTPEALERMRHGGPVGPSTTDSTEA